MLVREIRDACLEVAREATSAQLEPAGAEEEATPLEARIQETKATEEMGFVITPYKPNYVLVGYNPDPNEAPWQEAFPDEDIELDAAEIKFQISFMVPIVRNIIKDNGHMYIAYTNRSFWQAFNQEESLPFRETNHEPELWFQFENKWKILGFTNRLNSFGFVHQSNGRNEPISRSWNRLFANFIFERNNIALSIKPWIIIGDKIGNEDIQDYMGNVELRGAYKWRQQHVQPAAEEQPPIRLQQGDLPDRLELPDPQAAQGLRAVLQWLRREHDRLQRPHQHSRPGSSVYRLLLGKTAGDCPSPYVPRTSKTSQRNDGRLNPQALVTDFPGSCPGSD